MRRLRAGARWMTRHVGFPACAMLAGLLMLTGCQQPKGTRIELTTYDSQTGGSERYFADFRWAAYRWTASGRLELALRSETPSAIDPTQTVTQLVCIRTMWEPRPGRTYVNPSQINAKVQYAMMSPPTGVRYDGGAFVTYKHNQRTGEVTGRIESGALRPAYWMGDAAGPFGTATITGTFRATENPGDVVDTSQLIEQRFSKRATSPD